jgi:DNA-binding GntR family transcriptional regulator
MKDGGTRQSAAAHPAAVGTSPIIPITVTKAEAVYVEMRNRILTGRLAPGLAVNQEALAANMGVSITPLREALRRLEIEHLVRLTAHRTVVVTPLTRQELMELYVIRGNLDPLAAGLAGQFATAEQIAAIQQFARRKFAKDSVVQLERNRAFHRAIYSACGNESLIFLLDQLWDRTDRYRLILVKEEIAEGATSQQAHIEIADAIAARDADRATRLMHGHINQSYEHIAEMIREDDQMNGEEPAALGGSSR